MSRSAATWVSEVLLLVVRAAVGPDHALDVFCLEWFCIEKTALQARAGEIRIATGTKKFDSGI